MKVATYYDIIIGNDIARDIHCDITMCNDVTRGIHCDVTMSNDVAMCTYQCITMYNDVDVNLLYYVLLCLTLCYLIMVVLK